jgi:hypothetical protein
MDRLAQILVFVFGLERGVGYAHDRRARLMDLAAGRHQVLRRILQPFERRTERISQSKSLHLDPLDVNCYDAGVANKLSPDARDFFARAGRRGARMQAAAMTPAERTARATKASKAAAVVRSAKKKAKG